MPTVADLERITLPEGETVNAPLRILGPKPSLRAIQAERMRRSFKLFVQKAWAQVDTRPLVWGPHLDAMAAGLQAVADHRIQKLCINIPPGMAKSLFVSVLWPAWRWARDARWQVLSSAYEVGLPTRDAVKARDLMESEWYKSHFRSGVYEWKFASDQNNKTYYVNSLGGHRAAMGVGGKVTGYRGDCIIIDDPLNAIDAYSEPARETCKRWFHESMPTRLNDQAHAEQVLIMQRLHEDDLTTHALKDGFKHLNLQMVFEEKERCNLFDDLGNLLWADPRTREGELLFPQMFPAKVLWGLDGMGGLKKRLGSFGWAAQMQQRPIPAEGGYLKRAWFNRRWILPGTAPIAGLMCRELDASKIELIHMFTDAAFKKLEDSDRVAVEVWASIGMDIYLLDQFWDRADFTETCAAMQRLKKKWPRIMGVYVEDKANGSAIINTLKDKVPGIVPLEPTGSKEARIMAASPMIEAGNVWLPAIHAQVDDMISEACAFPKAAHDDWIDCCAYAVNNMVGKANLWALEALGKK